MLKLLRSGVLVAFLGCVGFVVWALVDQRAAGPSAGEQVRSSVEGQVDRVASWFSATQPE